MMGIVYSKVPKVCMPLYLTRNTFLKRQSPFMLNRTSEDSISGGDDENEVRNVGIFERFLFLHFDTMNELILFDRNFSLL